MAKRLHDSNGVLNDDRIRNTIIENHRRTTAAITAKKITIEEATERFRNNANKDKQRLEITNKSNKKE